MCERAKITDHFKIMIDKARKAQKLVLIKEQMIF